MPGARHPAPRAAALLAGGLLLGACAHEPLTREEAEPPESLVIPPTIVEAPPAQDDGEDAPAGAQAASGDTSGDEPPREDKGGTPARLVAGDGQEDPYLRLEMPPERAWQRTGVALDRLGFTVLEREREARRYTIRYDPHADEEIEQPGLLARWLGGAERIDTTPRRFRITLEQEGEDVRVAVQERSGEPAPAPIARRLLTLLDPQLY